MTDCIPGASKQQFFVSGAMPSLNKILFAKVRATIKLRQGWIEGVKNACLVAKLRPMGKVYMHYEHHRPDLKGDPSNFAAAAAKLIEDGLVQAGVLKDDSFKYITGFEHKFVVDKANPGVLVTLIAQ